MPKYAELIYNGFWFSPEREMLQVLIDKSQEMVAGRVRLKLYKGGVHVIGRDSPHSLYDQDLVTFEEGAVAYDHHDAGGFIKLNALRLQDAGEAEEEGREGMISRRRARVGSSFSRFLHGPARPRAPTTAPRPSGPAALRWKRRTRSRSSPRISISRRQRSRSPIASAT